MTEEEGWVSFEYTKKEPRPAFRYRMKKKNETYKIRFVTLVIPYKNEKPTIEIDIKEATNDNHQVLQLKVNGKKKIIEYNL